MTLPHQPSMWDLAEEASLGPLAGHVVRHPLSRGAWVDHLPGWVSGSDEVLEVLLGDIGWREDRRQMYDREVAVPRLLRWYGGRGQAPPPRACCGGTADGTRSRTRCSPKRVRLSTVTTGPSWASDSSAQVCACTAMAGTASPGTATGSAADGRRTRWSRSSRSVPRVRCCSVRPAAGRASGSRSATETWWSWAVPASAPGSTASRRPRSPSARG